MFLKKLDFISPPITLYFKGLTIHSSILSAIITIIAYIIIFIFSIYYFREFIQKSNPTAYFLNRFTEDAGYFPLNSSSMFHFIQFPNTLGYDISPIDFDAVRIIGIENITIDNYPSIDLENTTHWLYGYCNNDTDTGNIGHLITLKNFTHCACIRKYYNPNTKEYYDTNSTNFVWPILQHGMSGFNYTFYGVIVEKCKEDNLRKVSGLKSCKSKDDINNYVYSHAIIFHLIDQYSDVLNYENPFTKYIYSISNSFFPNYYTINHFNFNPAMIKTHGGIIFDKVIDEYSYFYSFNEKITIDEEIEVLDGKLNKMYDEKGQKIMKSSGIISSCYFWMQNRLQYYERNYKKIQNTLGDIGGLSRIVLICAFFINTFVSNYTILLDTEKLVLSLDDNDKLNFCLIEPNLYKKIDLKVNPPKRVNRYNNNNYQQSSNIESLKEDNFIQDNIFIENQKEIIKDTTIKKNNIINNNNNENKEEEKQKRSKRNKIKNQPRKTKNNIDEKYSEQKGKNNLNKKSNVNKFTKEVKGGRNININNSLKKQNFSWIKYFKYMIYCFRNNPSISFYEKLRAKIISEENIIKDHLKIMKLFKIVNIDKETI